MGEPKEGVQQRIARLYGTTPQMFAPHLPPGAWHARLTSSRARCTSLSGVVRRSWPTSRWRAGRTARKALVAACAARLQRCWCVEHQASGACLATRHTKSWQHERTGTHRSHHAQSPPTIHHAIPRLALPVILWYAVGGVHLGPVEKLRWCRKRATGSVCHMTGPPPAWHRTRPACLCVTGSTPRAPHGAGTDGVWSRPAAPAAAPAHG